MTKLGFSDHDGKQTSATYYYKSKDLPLAHKPKNVIRASDGCYEKTRMSAWGRCLTKVQDPESLKISYEDRERFILNEDFPKIPRGIWNPWIALCFHMCHEFGREESAFHDKYSYYDNYDNYGKKGKKGKKKGTYYDSDRYPKSTYRSKPNLEVQVVLLRDEETLTKWKLIVPQQVVAGGRVESELNNSCDILTGEEYDVFPPPGWIHAGTSHSHNTMAAFFSGTDNEYELIIPGLHIVIGSISEENNIYVPKASIAARGERKHIGIDEVVEPSTKENNKYIRFHDNCLKYISKENHAKTSSSYIYKETDKSKNSSSLPDFRDEEDAWDYFINSRFSDSDDGYSFRNDNNVNRDNDISNLANLLDLLGPVCRTEENSEYLLAMPDGNYMAVLADASLGLYTGDSKVKKTEVNLKKLADIWGWDLQSINQKANELLESFFSEDEPKKKEGSSLKLQDSLSDEEEEVISNIMRTDWDDWDETW